MLRRGVLVVVLLVAAAACGPGPGKEYGATQAGPTKVAKPLIADPPDQAPAADPIESSGPKIVTTSAGLCKLYTRDQIETWLGSPVRTGKPGESSFARCVWNGTGAPVKTKGGTPVPIVLSITRAPASEYASYQADIVKLAKSRKARGEQVVRGVGDEAYAIGASVKGIPIWYGGTRHGDWMTAVEMAGGGTKAGVASVTELLLDIIERG